MAIPVLAAPCSDESSRQRVITRIVLGFMQPTITRIAETFDYDLSLTIALLAIKQANLAPIMSRRELDLVYADAFPPMDALRPISTHALAQTLSLPPETMRRHVARLIRDGYCERVGRQGLRLTEDLVASPRFAQLEALCVSALGGLVTAIKALGYDTEGSQPGGRGRRAPPRAFHSLIARHLTDYLIRVIQDGIPIHGNLLNGMIFITVINENVRHITHDPELATRFAGADQPPQDEMRRPIRLRQLSLKLRLPYATLYRNVHGMIARGVCALRDGGVIVPTAAMQNEVMVDNGLRIHTWCLTCLRRLRELGVDLDHLATPQSRLSLVASDPDDRPFQSQSRSQATRGASAGGMG
jgi:DNA-binding transcriptional regulator YhcF (GntR family)